MTASPGPTNLPALEADELRHAATVEQHIRERIADAGAWLSFESFMELALYAPGLGYYTAGSIKLGPDGDFVTAPEISDLFSRCVARQCAEILEQTGGEILELGPGTGRMAAVVLETLAALDCLPNRYSMLEVSADLRERQRTRIAQLPQELQSRVAWLDRLPQPPLSGVVLANEVLDALPVRRFRVHEDGVRELGVAIDPHGTLVEREAAADEVLLSEYASLVRTLPESLPAGYVSELCPRVDAWIASLAGLLEKGVMLLLDYGLPRAHYYHPQRRTGTLRCHFRQRVHDNPLLLPGLQDITAWVDFTRVAEAADAAGLGVLGFATQAAFLLGTGIEGLIGARDPARAALDASEARRLLLPGEMGEAFKAIALGRGIEAELSGFSVQDLRAHL